LNSNEFCCAIVNGEHRIYQGPGFHFVVGVTDRIVSRSVIGEDINFGPIKIIYVKPGSLKFAVLRNTGEPKLLGPGMHHFNDLNLEIGREISMNFQGNNECLKCDDAGAFQFVFVKTGSAAIVIRRDGQLDVLSTGLHFIQAPDTLKTFVSIQQEHFKFGTADSHQSFLSADNVELHINATLFYRVVDVRALYTNRIKDEKDLFDTLHSQAMATLLTIIRSETFQSLGKKQQTKAMQSTLHDDFNASAEEKKDSFVAPIAIVEAVPIQQDQKLPPMKGKTEDALQEVTMGFQHIIHDAEPQFQRMMQSNFSRSGIEIQSLRIEQIEFADKEMQKQVSSFAMTNTKLISQQQTISAQRAIQVAEAERDAATLRIKTQAEADKLLMMTETENEIKIKTARAQAENQIILAEAEAQAKLKVGEAELQIMERQNAMPNAQLRIVTDAQKAVMSGIQKIIYTDQQSLLLKPYLAIPDSSVGGGVGGGFGGSSP